LIHLFQIIKKLSFYKLYNYLKLIIGFHLSRFIKKPIFTALPFSVSIEPTTSCNLRCPECPSGLRAFTRPIGMLQPVFFDALLQQIKKHVHSLTFYFQGEPYLNPDFLKMVKAANTSGIYTITSTNAHYLDEKNARETVESGLDKLIISVDGSSEESYTKYRVGGQYQKVLDGTKMILEQRRLLKSSHPRVVWQFIVFKHNEHEIGAIQKMAEEIGVDTLQIKTAQVYHFDNADDLIPTASKYARYRKNSSGKWKIKNKLLNQCWRMWQGCVITWDGSVVPCCFDKDAKYKVGNLQSQSFRSVWLSPEYNQFRQAILKGRSQIDICTNCTEGTKVWA
jgi:radical SAM protein with 4Fe4S-binding SPASM domain